MDYDQIRDILGVKIGVKRVKMFLFLEKSKYLEPENGRYALRDIWIPMGIYSGHKQLIRNKFWIFQGSKSGSKGSKCTIFWKKC